MVLVFSNTKNYTDNLQISDRSEVNVLKQEAILSESNQISLGYIKLENDEIESGIQDSEEGMSIEDLITNLEVENSSEVNLCDFEGWDDDSIPDLLQSFNFEAGSYYDPVQKKHIIADNLYTDGVKCFYLKPAYTINRDSPFENWIEYKVCGDGSQAFDIVEC